MTSCQCPDLSLRARQYQRSKKLDIANLILEYLKVLLTAPVLFSIVAILFILLFREDIKALILRIAKIRFPGGEVSTPQSNQLAAEERKPAPQPNINTQAPVSDLPADLTSQQKSAVEQLIRTHIATEYLWEYRYLNFFLVRGTQRVLDWLISLPQPTIYSHFDAVWLPLIPSANERQAIINALESHHLILQQVDSGMITVTPKG
jgi:hypothetical protein